MQHYLFIEGSTCLGLFLRPPSGAHNCTLSCKYCQPLLLQTEFHLIHDTSLQQYWLTVPAAEFTYVLLMMGGETARNT